VGWLGTLICLGVAKLLYEERRRAEEMFRKFIEKELPRACMTAYIMVVAALTQIKRPEDLLRVLQQV